MHVFNAVFQQTRGGLISGNFFCAPESGVASGDRSLFGHRLLSKVLGSVDKKGGMVVSPSLRKHVAEELGRDAAILKEKKKAAEARQKGKGGTKG